MIVYTVKNKINGKSYVGQTTRKLSVRWVEHCKGNGCGIKLQKAIRKYGKESFNVSVLEVCSTVEALNIAEAKWIKELDTIKRGYNLNSGGLNSIPSDETRKKMSDAQKLIQARNKEKTSIRMKKLWQSEEYRLLLESRRRGIKKSDTAKFNMSLSAGKRKKPVAKIKNGVVVETYPSVAEASRSNGYDSSNIFSCCAGRSNSAYGFNWKYIKDDLCLEF